MSTYFVDGYLDDDYFGVVDTTGYYLDDYIAVGYISDGVVHEAEAALVVSSTANASPGIVKSSGADLNGVFAPTIFAVASRNGSIDMAAQTAFASDAARTASTDVTLDNIVNLSLQAARIRDNAMSIAASFAATPIVSRTRATSSSLAISFEQTTTPLRIKQLDATLSGVFSPSITATASLNGSIDLHATATASADPTRIKQLDAALSTAFTSAIEGGYENEATAALGVSTSLTARAIQYVLRPNPYNRPINLNSPPYTFSTDKIEGSHSLEIAVSSNESSENTNSFAFASNENFVIDIYVKMQPLAYVSTRDTIYYGNPGSGLSWSIQLANGTYGGITNLKRIKFNAYSGGTLVATASENKTGFNQFSTNTWTRITITRTNGVITLATSQSGTRTTASYNGAFDTPSSNKLVFNPSAQSSWKFDRFRIARQTDTWPGAASTNAVIEYLFNNDANDNWYITHAGAATLATTASVTANLGGTFGAEADLTTTATTTADVDKVVNTSATLATAFATTATVDKILSADSTLASEFTTTANATRIQQGAISLTGAFAQTTTANIIAGATSDSIYPRFEIVTQVTNVKQLASDLTAFASTLTAAGKVGDFFVDVDLTATLASTAQRTAELPAGLDVNTALAADILRIHPGAVDLTTTATLSANGDLVAGTIANLDTTAALDSTAVRAKGLTADFASEFAATATGATFLGSTTFEGQVNTTLAATPKITRITSAALDVSTTQTVAGIKAVEASATLTGAFAPSITAVASRAGDIDLTVDSTQTATAAKTTETSSILGVSTAITATGTLTKQLSASPVCEANITSTAGVLVNTTSSISAAFTQTVIGTIIDTTRYVYVVPRELRVFTVDKETRTHTIHKETRTFTLGEL